MTNKYLIVIAGPTAIGKTSAAIKIAKFFNSEILSCDSRQLFKELNIGVAKPTNKELSEVKHHFINHISISEQYSAGRYEREGIDLINQLFESNDYLILTGGTGLYIKAILEGLDEFPEVKPEDFEYYMAKLEDTGLLTLQEELKIKDPAYYNEVDINNSRRLIRALSVIKSSRRTFSSFRNSNPKVRNFKPIPIQLTMDREMLYQRINKRVDHMINDGLLAEVESLINHKNLISLQTVGYSELFKHLNGDLSLSESVALIKRNTRRYAKRQITWFSNNGNFIKTPAGDINKLLETINTQIELSKTKT